MSKMVLWAEAHDEAQQLMREYSAIRLRLICQFMLSDKLIFHPSYVWRSDLTKKLVLQDFNQLFIPEFSEAILGGNSSPSKYLGDRISRLQDTTESPTSELINYKRNLPYIENEVKILDAHFSDSVGAYPRLRFGVEAVFREIVAGDLYGEGDRENTRTLAYTIRDAEHSNKSPKEIDEGLQYLADWTMAAPLFSRELMIDQMDNRIHFQQAAASQKVTSRLMHLYFRSNVLPDTEVPFLRHINGLFDPYDHHTFFNFLNVVLGDRLCRKFLWGVPAKKQSELIGHLKKSPEWLIARRAYFDLTECMNMATTGCREDLYARLQLLLDKEKRQRALAVVTTAKNTAVNGALKSKGFGYASMRRAIRWLGGTIEQHLSRIDMLRKEIADMQPSIAIIAEK